MRRKCAIDECSGLVHLRGLCRVHYHDLTNAGTFNASTEALYAESHVDWDQFASRLATLRLHVEAAHARVVQALYILNMPAEYPMTAQQCAADATFELAAGLAELETGTGRTEDLPLSLGVPTSVLAYV